MIYVNKIGKCLVNLLVLVCIAILCSCHSNAYKYHHSALGSVTLVAHSCVIDELRAGEMDAAQRKLEAKLRLNPDDAELNYTLGCVKLMQSDGAKGQSQKCLLQSDGWRHVELASGKYFPADNLLAHAFLTGRWGRKKNSDLYVKHLRLASANFRSQGEQTNQLKLYERSWVLLGPPR